MANLTDTTVFGNLTVTRDINIKKNLTIDGSIVVGGGTSSGYDVSIDGHFISASLTANTALYVDANKKIVSSAVTSTELSYLDGVTSAIQTQLNGKAATDQTMYIGTTSVAINRATGALSLTGVSIDGNSGTATTADKVAKSLTFNNGGSGAASGATFDGSAARTISYNTLGAQKAITGSATSITDNNLTASRALISDENGKVAVSSITADELSALSGINSQVTIQQQLNELVDLGSGSIVVRRNDVDLEAESNTVNILSGNPGFIFNSTNDTLLVFENFVYLLREGVDYAVDGNSIVALGENFKPAQYNFLVFKNIPLDEGEITGDLADHINSTAVHGATSGAVANSIAMRDGSGNINATNIENHFSSSNVHGATSGVVANSIAMRDGNGSINGYNLNATNIITAKYIDATENITAAGDVFATKVHNAVWNDIADFVEVPEDTIIEFGKAYARDKGKVRFSKNSDKNILGIASDTYGFGVGKNEKVKQIPFAIGGWVLAYTDKEYEFGTPLTFGEDGVLTEANLLTKIFFSDKIIAMFDRVEKKETWNEIKVNNRNWVRIL